MPFSRSSALIAITYLALSATALPRPNPVPTYQVVDVGGPSSESAAATVYSTVVESSTPSTIIQPAITVTATPSAQAAPTQSITTTQSWTVTIGNAEQPAYSHSAGSPPLPTLDSAATPATTTATQTSTVYNTLPVAPYAAAVTSSTTSSSLKSAFTSVSQWNQTVTEVHGPISAGTGLMYAAIPTGSTLAKRWYGATGTGAYLAGRAAPSGTGAYLAGRAAPTGYTGYAAEGWNATNYY
ncbi:hypothetical protein M409DRAFT_53910 [Zasmidium cellare ATCC 36951]|uniref:Uncharacterized protein n=1 Tax=Zasmidium cellare ATCC 36951 TaxID=1080233 RepID=A0A6A6CQ71_ZASCE|nr:uncharacterized protein M409DRAFT_53910 [Zasmidium cellare ATCC 36951]KAF2167972.1 hypothetical protein M409DRAFT_53910 [Zasmidium cellare ATCC 36951]